MEKEHYFKRIQDINFSYMSITDKCYMSSLACKKHAPSKDQVKTFFCIHLISIFKIHLMMQLFG